MHGSIVNSMYTIYEYLDSFIYKYNAVKPLTHAKVNFAIEDTRNKLREAIDDSDDVLICYYDNQIKLLFSILERMPKN